MKEFPVPSTVPPVSAAYHLIEAPALGVALKSTVPVPQRVPGVAAVTLFVNVI